MMLRPSTGNNRSDLELMRGTLPVACGAVAPHDRNGDLPPVNQKQKKKEKERVDG